MDLFFKLRARGQAPKALRWERLKQRYNAHKSCVTELLNILTKLDVQVRCVNRVELDRQHLENVDLVIAVGGDGTVLSAAHFLDHGSIPLLGINSDPNVTIEDRVVLKKTDERRSHGALCMCTALDMEEHLIKVLHGGGHIHPLTRIRCNVKSTFSETLLVPALNDILISNPSPAAVSRFRMGWLEPAQSDDNHVQPPLSQEELQQQQQQQDESSSLLIPKNRLIKNEYGTITRFGGIPYNVNDSINVWSSGMWISTSTGSTAAMKAAGGHVMEYNDTSLQYLIREHMIEQRYLISLQDEAKSRGTELKESDINNGMIGTGDKLHIRWNSQRGRIFIDGSHLTHNLELGDEILIDNQAQPLKMFTRN